MNINKNTFRLKKAGIDVGKLINFSYIVNEEKMIGMSFGKVYFIYCTDYNSLIIVPEEEKYSERLIFVNYNRAIITTTSTEEKKEIKIKLKRDSTETIEEIMKSKKIAMGSKISYLKIYPSRTKVMLLAKGEVKGILEDRNTKIPSILIQTGLELQSFLLDDCIIMPQEEIKMKKKSPKLKLVK